MKKIMVLLTFLALNGMLFSQGNLFPPTGNAGIGTQPNVNKVGALNLFADGTNIQDPIMAFGFTQGTTPNIFSFWGHIGIISPYSNNFYSVIPNAGIGDVILQARDSAEDIILHTSNPNGHIRLSTNNNTNNFENMTVYPEGNVAIHNFDDYNFGETSQLGTFQVNVGGWMNQGSRVVMDKGYSPNETDETPTYSPSNPILKFYKPNGDPNNRDEGTAAWISSVGLGSDDAGLSLAVNSIFDDFGDETHITMNEVAKFRKDQKVQFIGYSSTPGSIDRMVTIDEDGILKTEAIPTGSGNSWELNGNSITSGNFLGTTNDEDLIFKRNSSNIVEIHEGGNVLFTGDGTNPGTVPVSGAGTRMMWIPEKAAFRAGEAWGTEWDYNEIGDYSVALGDGNKAKGDGSFSMGLFGNEALGDGAVSMGTSNIVKGDNSVAIGANNNSDSPYSIVFGQSNTADGLHGGIAIGHDNVTESTLLGDPVAIGNENTSKGDHSVAVGFGNSALGNESVSIGFSNVASHNYSFAIGKNATTTSHNQFMSKFTGTGSNTADQANAAYVLLTNSAGTTGSFLGASATGWSNISDRTKKKNIVELNNVDILSAFENIPVSKWEYKGVEKQIEYIGPMAQDIHANFDLKGKNKLSLNTVDMDGINFAGVRALVLENKELKAEIENIKSRLSALENNQNFKKQSSGSMDLNYNNIILEQNTPNPLTDQTTVNYFVPEEYDGTAEIVVSDMNGNLVVSSISLVKGSPSQVVLNCSNLDAGVYNYGISLNGKLVQMRKMMIMK